MKKHLFLAALLMACMAMNASIIIDETFAVADNITNLADATDWTTTGTLETGDGRVILSTPLEYSNTGGEYVLSGEGKAVQNIYTKGSNYIAYKQITKVNSDVVYMSYLYKGDGNQGQSQSEIIGLAKGTGNSSVKAWAGKQADQTKNPFRLGITRASTTGSDIQWCDDQTIAANTVTLIVLKYDFDTQAASLFINPTVGTTEEPTANAIDSDKSTAQTSLAYLMFKHTGSSVANFTVGGVRVSTTWAEAVAKKSDAVLPALATPVAGAASAIGAEEFTANWAAVENAIGYKVKVYAGENEIALQSVMGQAAVSATFANMPIATELTYTVTAVGDGVAYDDSEESAASAVFSTLAAPAAVVFNPAAAEWAEFACDKGAYSTGSFPSARVNGYDFEGSYIEVSKDEDGKSFSITCEETGERFTARAMLDKNTNSGSLTFPAVASAARVDMYITAGTADKKYKVQQYNYSTGNWADLQEIAAPKSPVAMVSVTPNEGIAKLRIANADGSAKQIWKVVTYAAAPATLSAPVVGEATDLTATGFTANWAAVENAAGYRVLVTSADTLIRTTTAAEVTSLVVTNLNPETEYTVKVAAIGDDAAFVGSVLSEAKVITTPADQGTGVDGINAKGEVRKVVVNGQMLIEHNGEFYYLTGTKVQ